MRKLFDWIKKETLHVFPVFLFFFICFNVINLTLSFLLKRAGLSPFTYVEILIAAGLIAKILLVIDHLPVVNIFHRHPLIYTVVWKTLFYSMITVCVRVTLRLIPFLGGIESLKLDLRNFFAQMDWRLFFAIQIWNLMLFFIFVTGRELTRVIGPAKMRQIFFGR